MTATSKPETLRSFHGWKILALATFAQFVSAGFTVYLLGLYIEPLSKTFNTTPGQLGWASTLFMAVPAIMGPITGYLADKGKIRPLMLSGAIAMGLGLLALSQARSLLHAGLACGLLLAPGSALINIVPAGAMLVQWFNRRRGFALGVAAAGISLGGLLMPPIVALLLSNYEWRLTSQILGLVVLLVMVPAILKIAIAKPDDIGQYPDGDNSPMQPGESNTVSQQMMSYPDILRRLDFWIITATVATIYFASVMLIVYLVPFSREHGFTTQQSALLLSVYAGAALSGKFVAGWLCDRFQPRRVFTGITATMAVGFLPMLFFSEAAFIPVSIALIGLGASGMIPVWLTIIAVNFGNLSFGRAKGSMSLALVFVAVTPGPLGGYLYDLYGSYKLIFSLLVPILLAGTLFSLLIPKPDESEP